MVADAQPAQPQDIRAANCGRIEELGGRKEECATDRGEERSMNFRVVDMKKAFASVRSGGLYRGRPVIGHQVPGLAASPLRSRGRAA